MTYTAEHPNRPDIAELRARIPGWGVDLDPNDRPSVPKLKYDPQSTGAHWDFPDRQEQFVPRERSIEHKFVTPVFGTATPLHGLSGAIRRYSYLKYSEARAAHWLLLIAADRVDAVESHLRSFLTLRPDNPITQTGVKAEFTHNGWRSRTDGKRADLNHQWIDPILVGAPWLMSAGAGAWAVRAMLRRFRG
ncbi:hypothetical protein ABQE93_05700 [Mycolicibacterium sp. XJ662]